MDTKLEDKLVEKYPDMFEEHYYISDDESPPHPQIGLYGFECGDGWYDIIDALCETISRTGVSINVTQVKEKFGSLRFYYHTVDDEGNFEEMRGAIRMAERMSERTCEYCGSVGVRQHNENDWITTLCYDCREKDVTIEK